MRNQSGIRFPIGYLIVLISGFVFCSCNSNKTFQAEIEAFIGQQVLSPDSTDIFSAENKLIVWFDSTECASCRMSRMYEWDDDPAVQYAQGLKGKFSVVMIFSPKKKDVRSLQINLDRYDLSFPVIVDEQGRFPQLNPHIPTDRRLHAFLLDKNNRVVLVGNPLGNEPLWELYREQIRTLVNER